MSWPPKFECSVMFIPPEHGGRASLPKLSGNVYRPTLVIDGALQISFIDPRTNEKLVGDDHFGVLFDEGPSDGLFGTELTVTLNLVDPKYSYSRLKPGVTFTVREGPKTVGKGRVIREI